MPDLASNQESVERAILAYKSREFKDAINILLEVTDQEPNNWRAKLYLGMSYFNCGDILLASGQFRFLTANCTDAAIREKAQTALSALSAQVQSQAKMPQMSCTIKKSDAAKVAPKVEATIEVDDADLLEVASDEGYYKHADFLAKTEKVKGKKRR